jgi:hypothetical protein
MPEQVEVVVQDLHREREEAMVLRMDVLLVMLAAYLQEEQGAAMQPAELVVS